MDSLPFSCMILCVRICTSYIASGMMMCVRAISIVCVAIALGVQLISEWLAKWQMVYCNWCNIIVQRHLL